MHTVVINPDTRELIVCNHDTEEIRAELVVILMGEQPDYECARLVHKLLTEGMHIGEHDILSLKGYNVVGRDDR